MQTFYDASDGCGDCRAADPDWRHLHYLALAKRQSLEEVRRHILDDLLDRFPDDQDRARGYANDIMLWLSDQVISHTGLLDPQTGAMLSWWEGRAQKIRAIKGARGAEPFVMIQAPAPERIITPVPDNDPWPDEEEMEPEDTYSHATLFDDEEC